LRVSVLFSEPKIPQWMGEELERRINEEVSVLFSEPKIPQCRELVWIARCDSGFSALQRAENSSI